ncbi:MAG: MsnO8 family LLM class oxidoreductase [Litorilinea sp.]
MQVSLVDLTPVLPGESRHAAFQHSIEVAQHIERLGFHRVWVAEHHGAGSVAGRAPEVLIPVLAANTTRLRIGSGSVLLNHYSPYKVAEVFCTLHEIYPNRIDLGVGRATTGPYSDLALQQDRSRHWRSDSDAQIVELLAWLEDGFPPEHPFATIPVRTLDTLPEVHLLGSSGWSAGAAAQLGLRYVFAGFIAQETTPQAIRSYRENFKPGTGPTRSAEPEVRLAVKVVCADTEEEARRQLAPAHVMYRNLAQGNLTAPLLAPDEAVDALGRLPDLQPYVSGTGVPPKFIGGTPTQVHATLADLTRDLDVKELFVQDLLTDHAARLRSYALLAEVCATL